MENGSCILSGTKEVSGLAVLLLLYLLQFQVYFQQHMQIHGCLTFLLFSIRIDIDECLHPHAHSCYGICKNLPGSFQCQCPQGTYGDPTMKGGCIKIKNSFPGDESSQYIEPLVLELKCGTKNACYLLIQDSCCTYITRGGASTDGGHAPSGTWPSKFGMCTE